MSIPPVAYMRLYADSLLLVDSTRDFHGWWWLLIVGRRFYLDRFRRAREIV